MQCSESGGAGINSYALVSYIQGPLGSFLDRLRSEMVAGCTARAHVTLLPPRPLLVTATVAAQALPEPLQRFPAFSAQIDHVAAFEKSSVIYLEIGQGAVELRQIHDLLNTGVLAFDEPHQYQPHITVAQDLIASQVPALLELAQRRWREWRGPKSFEVEKLTFVQNTDRNKWMDLAGYSLHEHAATRR